MFSRPIWVFYSIFCQLSRKKYIVEEYVKFGLGEKVVLRLTNHFGIEGYFDNYFTSIKLSEKLLLENTLAGGIFIKFNRKGIFPPLTVENLLKRGIYDFKTHN